MPNLRSSATSTGFRTRSSAAPSSTNYGTLNGSNNTIGITQHGNGNSNQYNIQGGTTGYNVYNSTVTGNDNQTNLSIGNANNANNGHDSVTETITGDSNMILTNIVGSNNTLSTTLNGSSNQVTQNVTTSNASISSTTAGGYNIMNFQQTDAAGANGHHHALRRAGGAARGNDESTVARNVRDLMLNLRRRKSQGRGKAIEGKREFFGYLGRCEI